MNPSASVEALLTASAAACAASDHATGSTQARQALACAEASAAQRARAQALLAEHALRLDDYETSVREAQLALTFYVEQGDLLAQSRLHCWLVMALHNCGMMQQALQHAANALTTARACGDLHAECWALSRSSMVYESMDEQSLSLEFGERCVALARSLGDDELLFAALNNMASTRRQWADQMLARGDNPGVLLHQAVQDAEEALALSLAQNNHHREAIVRSNLGPLLHHLGRPTEARAHMTRSIAVATELRRPSLAQEAHFGLQALDLAEGRADEAITGAMQLLRLMQTHKDSDTTRRVHEFLYLVHKGQGDFERALLHHEGMHAEKLRELEQKVQVQSRILLNQLALDDARHQAEQAQRDAVLQRMRAEELDRAAHSDALTGLLNRRFLDRQLPLLMTHAKAHTQPLAAAMIDIDHFKQVNDSHGHAIGDQVLKELAVLLRQATRGSDMAIRMGGEEFLVVLVDTAPSRASEVCERLRQVVLAHSWQQLAPGLSCTVSIGVSQWQPGEEMAHWVHRTDTALYAAKHQGRNRVVVA
jgi:diguanylate cyclase (GGDEF)-like protein